MGCFTNRFVSRMLCSKLYLKAESQEIDRILESFARRYWHCNMNQGLEYRLYGHTGKKCTADHPHFHHCCTIRMKLIFLLFACRYRTRHHLLVDASQHRSTHCDRTYSYDTSRLCSEYHEHYSTASRICQRHNRTLRRSNLVATGPGSASRCKSHIFGQRYTHVFSYAFLGSPCTYLSNKKDSGNLQPRKSVKERREACCIAWAL